MEEVLVFEWYPLERKAWVQAKAKESMKTYISVLIAVLLAQVASAGVLVTNPVEKVRGALPVGWTIIRVETNTYPFYRPEGKGTGIFLGIQGKRYSKQDYSAVLYIMPLPYEDGGEDPTHGQAQTSPPRLIATTDKAKVYLWPGPEADGWGSMQKELLAALFRKE